MNRGRVLLVVGAVALLVALVSALLGASAWPSVALSAVVVASAVGRSYGYWLGVATAVVLAMLAVLLVLTATAALGMPMSATLSAVATAVAVVILVRVARGVPITAHPLERHRVLPLLAASTGGVVVAVALAASQRLSAPLRLDWVMRNDSPNNLIFARQAIERGGVALGGGQNPAPLPSSLVAVTAAPFRGDVAADALLVHDLSAMAETWAALIAVTCLLSGLVAAAIARRAGASLRFVTGTALVASLVVLSWFFTGYPMQFGFLNTHVALVVLLAAVLAYLSSARAPWLGLSVVLASAIIMLGVWSPLVVVPAGLTVAFASWRSLWSTRGARLAVLSAVSAALIAYALLVTLPVLLEQREALSGLGGVFNPGNAAVFIVGAGVIILAFLVFRSLIAPEALGVAGVVVMSWVGLGVLLLGNRDQPDPFTYYPVKLAWTAMLLFVVIGIGLACALASRLRAGSVVQVAAVGAVVAVVAALVVWVPTWGERNAAQHPLGFIAAGNAASGYPTLDSYVLDFVGAEAPAVLWNSGFNGEGDANIWIMQMAAGSLDSELRLLPFESYDDKDPRFLCRIQELMGPGLTVHTADTELDDSLRAVCPASTAVIVVEQPRAPSP